MIDTIHYSTTPLLENAQRAESHRTMQMLIEQNARKENDQKKEEKAEPVHGWILCSEKLPEVEVPVLIYHNFRETGCYEKITIGHLHKPEDRSRKPFWQWVACDKIYKEWISDYHRAEFICPGDEYVIAWMPLPESPKIKRLEGES
ncbi:MAG: DUF551 domain-containing protein [Clostridiales bacterium]|nr:DUF551 domain-containing protein [Clostridiales bacterium]